MFPTPSPLPTHENPGGTNPLVSVVVPVYKVEPYLKRCLDSVIGQTYGNLEIILVDDGSPDRCGEICDEYAMKDSRVRVIHQKNGGLSAARNAALDVASGEYVGFVDSDDYIHPEMYECLLGTIIDQEADIAVCNFFTVKGGEIRPESDFDSSLSSDSLKLRMRTALGGTAVWRRIFRASLFDGVRFPEGRLFEDLILTPQLYKKARKIAGSERCLYYYNQDNVSSIMSSLDLNIFSRFEHFRAFMDRIDDDGLFRDQNLVHIAEGAFHLLRDNAALSLLDEQKVEFITGFIERFGLHRRRRILWFCFKNARPLFDWYGRYRFKSIKKRNAMANR